MDVVQENSCGEILRDAFNEKLVSPESPDACDGFRDSELLPRVGDRYQVEIPPLMAGCDCFRHSNSPPGAKFSCEIPRELVGLPISIMWIEEEVLEPLDCPETVLFSEGRGLKPEVEPLEIHQKHRGKGGCRLVPGSAGDTWSDVDEACFLLGLYIFGKNLAQVKKFVERKRMGEILSFYYGKFYRSDKYCRWSECRKMRSRRCVYGQRIFTGLRQQELLSRLLLHVSEECKKTLLEDTKALGDGKMSLEEYVLRLKAKFGLNSLVEAVGIGKGKRDLTGMAAMEPPRSSQLVSICPEIPTGKACSTLAPSEIIKFLTGGYRLSKARSNDLFWEAVWPRLLGRGWHSEQPSNLGCAAGYKNCLVFLIPGVQKFSRRKLVKGNHYFDSVSDVLSRVAEDPALLELEIVVADKEEKDGNTEENAWTDETKLGREDFPDQQRSYCYLKPRTPNRGMDVIMEFTVVDTSLANEGRFKVRDLRSLPVESRNTPTSRCHSEDSEEETSEESSNDCFLIRDPDSTNAPAVEVSDQKNNMCDEKPRKTVKARLVQRKKPESNIHFAPVTKRHRKLNACDRRERTSSQGNASVGARLNKDGLTNSSSKSSHPVVSGDEGSHKEPPPRREIDLNLPVPPDSETDEPFMEERTEYDQKACEPVATSEQQPTENARRHSTRNRPLTTKALEALAFDVLTTKQKRKFKDVFLEEKTSPSRPARGRIRVTEDLVAGMSHMTDFQAEERGNIKSVT